MIFYWRKPQIVLFMISNRKLQKRTRQTQIYETKKKKSHTPTTKTALSMRVAV